MTDPLLNYPVVTVLFILLTMINLFLNNDEKRYDWKKISTIKIAIYTSCILYVTFAIMLIQIPDYTSDFLINIKSVSVFQTCFAFSKANLLFLLDYSPAYLISINVLYPLFFYDNALLIRFVNLGFFTILQFLIYKISLVLMKKNHKRTDYKAGFALFFSSPFVILNIILVEGINLYITVLLVFGIYLLLKNHVFLAGLIFGYLAMVLFTYFLFFIGLIWYVFKKNGKSMMIRFLFGGIPTISIIVGVFTTINTIYTNITLQLINFDYVLSMENFNFNYAFYYSYIYNLNIIGLITKWLEVYNGYILPANFISLIIFLFLMRYLRIGFSTSKSLVDIFIASFFLTINLSYFFFIGILSLICIGASHAKRDVKNLYITLNILFFIQFMLLYLAPSELDPIILTPQDVILYCFVIFKLFLIDINLIKIMRNSAPIKTPVIVNFLIETST